MDTKQLVLRYYDEVWRDGNVDAIDELLAPDHVDETPPPGFDGTRDAQKQIASRTGWRSSPSSAPSAINDEERDRFDRAERSVL
jgi:hypothetical protein